jgi:hypothetical protein
LNARVELNSTQINRIILGLLRLLAANQDTVATQDEILRNLRQMVRQKQESEEPGL